MSEPNGSDLEELERRLDAAFATTRPRRGFEDELWAQLTRRRAWWRRLAWPQPLRGPAPLAGLALVVVAGLVVVVVAPFGARALHGTGGGTASTAAAPAHPQYGSAEGLPFGPLPLPRAASTAPSAAIAGSSRANVPAGPLLTVPDHLPVYRYRAASGPPDGRIFDEPSPPPGAESALYPTRSVAEAVSESSAMTDQAGQVSVTGARLVYVSVTEGQSGYGYLEPAYLLTATAPGDGRTITSVVLPAVARAALR